MRANKVGANERCPCGTGKKFKKCCRDKTGALAYSRGDRETAFAKLDFFIEEQMGDEEELAYDEFWGLHLDRADELPPDWTRLSNDVHEQWFAFDRLSEDGSPAVVLFLEQAGLTAGERAFLTSLWRSSMRLYEVVDAVPGVSLRLRDVVEGKEVTVNERSGSKSIDRYEWLAARVVSRGPSGGPEIEAGTLHIPRLLKDGVLGQIREQRSTFLREHPGADINDFYKTLPPLFHEAWVGGLLDPSVPELRNADGEEMIVTRVHFDLVDAETLTRAMDAHAELERDGDAMWQWTVASAQGEPVLLGRVERRGDSLTLEADSVSRGARGRSLIETVGGNALRHRATTHENLRRSVQDAVRARVFAGELEERDEPRDAGLPPAVADALTLGYYAKHYRAWVDDPVPALDGQTPRQASSDSKLRPRVIDLIHGLEGMYQGALRQREPAYDPSWMWSELGLIDPAASLYPPPLAHERVAERVPGSAELSRTIAKRICGDAGFADSTSSLSREAFDHDLELQRFVRDSAGAANGTSASSPQRGQHQNESGTEGSVAAPYLRLMVNFELHRRKAFWVDEALSYMLSHTDFDVVGREVRVPFASFALVFTDRQILSLAERVLATRDDCPLSGQLLRVATVYVTEEHRGDARSLELCFALDALGADLPELLRHEISLPEEAPLQGTLDAVAPLPILDAAVVDADPTRGLLRATINAILYITSAGVEPECRAPVKAVTRVSSRGSAFSSEEVYFLPGTIDITRVRRMQELERVPDGSVLLHRHTVRGHWRRAQRGWTDQRLRWIEPYWKGPDMAAIIERAYRVKP